MGIRKWWFENIICLNFWNIAISNNEDLYFFVLFKFRNSHRRLLIMVELFVKKLIKIKGQFFFFLLVFFSFSILKIPKMCRCDFG